MGKKVKFIDNRDPILEKDDVFNFFLGNANSPPLYPLYQPIIGPDPVEPDSVEPEGLDPVEPDSVEPEGPDPIL